MSLAIGGCRKYRWLHHEFFSADDAAHVVLGAAGDGCGRRRIDHSTNHGRRTAFACSRISLSSARPRRSRASSLPRPSPPLFRIAPSRQCFVRFETLEFLSHLSRAPHPRSVGGPIMIIADQTCLICMRLSA